MSKVNIDNWYAVSNKPAVHFVKAQSPEMALAHFLQKFPNTGTSIVQPLDAWAFDRDMLAANELQFALGLLPEVNTSEGHIVLAG